MEIFLLAWDFWSFEFLRFWSLEGNPDWISWSWNEASLGSGDRHLRNKLGKCLVSYPHIRSDPYLIKIDPGINTRRDPPYVRQDAPADKEGQRFYLLDLLTYPGFFIIKASLKSASAFMGTRIKVWLKFEPLIAILQKLVSAGNGVTHNLNKNTYPVNSTKP